MTASVASESPNLTVRQAQAYSAFDVWFAGNDHIHGVMRNAFREVFVQGWMKADACPQEVDSTTAST